MKTNVKQILMSLAILLVVTVNGYAQEKTIDLNSPEVRTQVFDQILNDHQLMMDFMAKMNTNDHAMNMMMGNMMKCCDTDSSACKNMSAMMAEHDKVLEQLGKELDKKGRFKVYAAKTT